MPAREHDSADAADTALLVACVREAGEIARHFFRGTYSSWDKGRGNPVTEADIAIDRKLREQLLAARPDYGWLSEETEDDLSRLSRERVFVVDPIDGTLGFLKGRPQFTIVGTVVTKGRPVAAAIHNPMTGEMYEATAGDGAFLNGETIRVSAQTTIAGASVLAPKDYFQPKKWRSPWPESMRVETRSSIAYRLALVAAGGFDAMLSLTAKHDWDLAAGDLIACEAGACVTTPDGLPLTYNSSHPLQRGILSAGPALHAAFLKRLEGQLD